MSLEAKVNAARRNNARIKTLYDTGAISRDQALTGYQFFNAQNRQTITIPGVHLDTILEAVGRAEWGDLRVSGRATLEAVSNAVCKHLGLLLLFPRGN